MFSDESERIFAPRSSWQHRLVMVASAALVTFGWTTLRLSGMPTGASLVLWLLLAALCGSGLLSLAVVSRYRYVAIIPGAIAGLGASITTYLLLIPSRDAFPFGAMLTSALGIIPGILLLRVVAKRKYYHREQQPDRCDPEVLPLNSTDTAALGRLDKTFTISAAFQQKCLTIAALALLISLLGAYIRAAVELQPDQRRMLAFGIAVGIVVAFVAIAIWLWQRGRRIELHELGFVERRFWMRRCVMWDDIQIVRSQVWQHQGQEYRWLFVNIPRIRRVKLTGSLQKSAALMETISQQFIRRRLAHVLAALETEQPVVFGNLALTKTGFNSAGQVLGFESVRVIRLEDNVFEIYRHGHSSPWYSRPFSEIPNGPLMLAALEACRANTDPKRS